MYHLYVALWVHHHKSSLLPSPFVPPLPSSTSHGPFPSVSMSFCLLFAISYLFHPVPQHPSLFSYSYWFGNLTWACGICYSSPHTLPVFLNDSKMKSNSSPLQLWKTISVMSAWRTSPLPGNCLTHLQECDLAALLSSVTLPPHPDHR